MGRYAFFNTGLEYKFRFAVQPSEDIWEFGGTHDFEENSDPQISWTEKDIPIILNKLRDMEDAYGLLEFNCSNYGKSLKETYKLKDDLRENLDLVDKTHCKYLLGWLIYHQLLYQPRLIASYEI